MRQPSVLSLAWKYHPAITSGVGVACEGLNNALSKLVDLTVIYPTVTTVKHEKELILTGEDLPKEKQDEIYKDYLAVVEGQSYTLDVLFDPYFVSNTSGQHSRVEHQHKTTVSGGFENTKEEIRKTITYDELIYDDVDVFGENVKDKIYLYNRLVESLALGFNFDIIHAHDWMTFLAGIMLKERFHKPLILHVHSLEYDRVGHENVSWVYGIERFAMSKADLVITTSEYTKGIIEENYGLSSRMIYPVNNAVSVPDKIHENHLPENGRFRVLFAGRIDGNKGLEYFIQIASQVLKRRNDIEFIVVGRGKRDVCFEKLKDFKTIKSNFQYLGYVERDQLFGLYKSCDALCMPSISEPFGLTAIEAAASGLPVILSTKTGASEILSQTPKADFWDIPKFADFIVSMRDNPMYRERIIQQNRASVSKLTWDQAAEKVFELYKKLL